MSKSKNNFWLENGHSEQQIQDNLLYKTRKLLQPSIVYSPYTRLNQQRLGIKKLGGFISDSTAVNISDPSSMTD